MAFLTIKRIDVAGNAYSLATCFALLGSAVYIYSQSFAVGTIVVLIGGLFLAISKLRMNAVVDKNDIPAYVALIALFILSAIALAVYGTYPNAQYLKSFVFNLLAFISISTVFWKRFEYINKGVVWFLLIILIVAMLQAGYLFWGVGPDPVRANAADYVAENAYSYSGVRSIFTNPNDLSLVCCLLMVYFTQVSPVSERIKMVIVASLAAVIVLSASRTCIFVATIVVGLYYLKKPRQWIVFAICLAVLWLSLSAAADSGGTGVLNTYWGRKIASISTIATNYVDGGIRNVSDGSVDQRSAGYRQFLTKFDEIGIGSFKAQDYSYLMKGDVLFQADPHSLPIEMSLLYGYVGLVIFIIYMWWMFSSLMRSAGIMRSLSFTFIFFLLTFVSSSEINFPSFWIVTFLIVFGSRWRKGHEIYLGERVV